jgi:hypothetical protein
MFDFETETDDAAVRAVAAEMSGSPLAPLSPEEIALREIERETQQELYRQHEEQWRLEHEQERAARAEQEKAEWLLEHRKQEAIRQRERQEQLTRDLHQRELRDMRFQLTQAKSWQRSVDDAANRAVRQQYRQTLMGELEAMINPPVPPPEPEPQTIVISDEGSPELGSPDFDVRAFNKKSRPWW